MRSLPQWIACASVLAGAHVASPAPHAAANAGSDSVASPVRVVAVAPDVKTRGNIQVADFVAGDGVSDDTAALQRLVGGLGRMEATLEIAVPLKITGNITIPANLQLRFSRSGRFTGSGKINVLGTLDASRIFIFDPRLDVVLARTAVHEVFPEWWGAVADDSTEDGPALQKMLDVIASIPESGPPLWVSAARARLGPGTYKVSQQLQTKTPGGLVMQGDGFLNTAIHCVLPKGTSDCLLVRRSSGSQTAVTLRDFSMYQLPRYGGRDLIHFESGANVEMSYLWLDGAGRDGLWMGNAIRAQLVSLRIEHSYRNGLWIGAGELNPDTSTVVNAQGLQLAFAKTGSPLFVSTCNACSFTNCSFEGAGYENYKDVVRQTASTPDASPGVKILSGEVAFYTSYFERNLGWDFDIEYDAARSRSRIAPRFIIVQPSFRNGISTGTRKPGYGAIRIRRGTLGEATFSGSVIGGYYNDFGTTPENHAIDIPTGTYDLTILGGPAAASVRCEGEFDLSPCKGLLFLYDRTGTPNFFGKYQIRINGKQTIHGGAAPPGTCEPGDVFFSGTPGGAHGPAAYCSAPNTWSPLTFGGVSVPKSSQAPCTPGQIAMDSEYLYYCATLNSWRRVPSAHTW
jgi:hypothetical protein